MGNFLSIREDGNWRRLMAGPTGPRGITGATGSVGVTGSVGATGVAGATGATGPTGYDGGSELRGAKGPRANRNFYVQSVRPNISASSQSKTMQGLAWNWELNVSGIALGEDVGYSGIGDAENLTLSAVMTFSQLESQTVVKSETKTVVFSLPRQRIFVPFEMPGTSYKFVELEFFLPGREIQVLVAKNNTQSSDPAYMGTLSIDNLTFEADRDYMDEEVDNRPSVDSEMELVSSSGVASAYCDLIDLLATAKGWSSATVAAMKAIYGA